MWYFFNSLCRAARSAADSCLGFSPPSIFAHRSSSTPPNSPASTLSSDPLDSAAPPSYMEEEPDRSRFSWATYESKPIFTRRFDPFSKAKVHRGDFKGTILSLEKVFYSGPLKTRSTRMVLVTVQDGNRTCEQVWPWESVRYADGFSEATKLAGVEHC